MICIRNWQETKPGALKVVYLRVKPPPHLQPPLSNPAQRLTKSLWRTKNDIQRTNCNRHVQVLFTPSQSEVFEVPVFSFDYPAKMERKGFTEGILERVKKQVRLTKQVRELFLSLSSNVKEPYMKLQGSLYFEHLIFSLSFIGDNTNGTR